MTPLGRWLLKKAEQVLDRYYEGPTPPARLRDPALAFANDHPHATRADWAEFAAGHAEEAYRQGYVRGVAYVERDPDWRPDLPPEVLADMLDEGWRSSPPVDLRDPHREVPAAWTEEKLVGDGLEATSMLNAARRR